MGTFINLLAFLLILFTVVFIAKNNMRAIIGIGSGVIIYFIVLFFTSRLLPYSINQHGVALIVGCILYFLFVFPYCTINVPPDRAWVVANEFKTESAMEQAEFTGFREIRAQKEFGAGFHWIFFWEFSDKEVNLTRQILIENDENEPYTLADGNTIIVKWQIFAQILPGNVVNYIRHRPKDIQTRIGNRTDGFVQGYFGAKKAEEVTFDQAQLLDLKREYTSPPPRGFGPQRLIDDDERALGVWVGDIEAFDIDQAKIVQEGRNISTKVSMFLKLADDLLAKGMPFESVWKFITALATNTKIELVELGGFLPKGKK